MSGRGLQAGAGDCSAGPAPPCRPQEPTPAARCRGALARAVRAAPPKAGACSRSPRGPQPPLPQPLSPSAPGLVGTPASARQEAGSAPRTRVLWLPREWPRAPGSQTILRTVLRAQLPPASGLPACGLQAGLGALPPDKERPCRRVQGEAWPCCQRCSLEAAAKLPVLPGCPLRTGVGRPLLVLPEGPRPGPKAVSGGGGSRHTGPGFWGAHLASHQDGSCDVQRGRAGPSGGSRSTAGQAGKAAAPRAGDTQGLAMPGPSTWAVPAGH